MVIKATILYNGIEKLTDQYITIEDDKITKVSPKEEPFEIEGIVTPAFIDAHSHIGMFREGEPSKEAEGNDKSDQIQPLNNPLHSIYMDDKAFQKSIDFGVLYSCVVPGSGNLIGGKSVIIRHFASHIDQALVKEYGYKMSLGYNPISTTNWKGKRPNTRMGTYAMLENRFDTLLQKERRERLNLEKKLYKTTDQKEIEFAKEEFDLSFTPEEKELLKMLSGKVTIKVHAHKEDDIIYLISLVKKYNLKVTLEHAVDVFNQEIFEKLKQNDIPIVYGPLGTGGYKTELKHASHKNAKALLNSKAFFGLMSDHPVIHVQNLRDLTKYFLILGMSEAEAISLLTYNNAKILEIDDKLGSIQKDKLASLIVWSRDPFHLGAFPKMVMGEGKVLRR